MIFALAVIGAAVLVASRSVSIEAAYPVEHAKQAFVVTVWSRIVGFFRGSSVCAENIRLKREVAALSVLKGDVARLESENARLRRVLGYRPKTSGSWLVAGVLSAGGGAAGVHDTVRVDKGSLAGVREGAIVIVPEGLVGRVTSVTPHTSEITLITDLSSKVACETTMPGNRKVSGILTGGGEGRLSLRHLTGAEKGSFSARVLTSGRGGVFPRGMAAGTLTGVREDTKGLSYEGEVRPTVDFSTLEDVFIHYEK